MKIQLQNDRGGVALEFTMDVDTEGVPSRLHMFQAQYRFDRTIKHRDGGQTIVLRQVR